MKTLQMKSVEVDLQKVGVKDARGGKILFISVLLQSQVEVSSNRQGGLELPAGVSCLAILGEGGGSPTM